MRNRAVNEQKPSGSEGALQIVTFRVGPAEYGLDITAITEVVRPLKITELPRMPQFVEGVINLRGEIIPVVDLRKRFAVREGIADPRRMRMLITRGAVPAGRGLLGLIVDSVQEVLAVPKKDIDRAPDAARGEHADFIGGVGKMGDRLIILVDITTILSRQERTALAEAGNADH